MWKGLGVGALWGALLAQPLALAAPRGDLGDPGDPFALAAPAKSPPAPVPKGAFATIHFKNEVGKAFSLVEAHFVLDGQDLPTLTNIKPGSDVVIYAGRVAPGRHLASARLVYRGARRGGVITYMKGYRLTVEAEGALVVPPEQAVQFTISGKQNKGLNVPFGKQLGVEVHDRTAPGPRS